MDIIKNIDFILIEGKKTKIPGVETNLIKNLLNWYKEKKELGWDKIQMQKSIDFNKMKSEILSIIKDEKSTVSNETEKKYIRELSKQKNVNNLWFWVWNKIQFTLGDGILK